MTVQIQIKICHESTTSLLYAMGHGGLSGRQRSSNRITNVIEPSTFTLLHCRSSLRALVAADGGLFLLDRRVP
jgi:hypothetical protein